MENTFSGVIVPLITPFDCEAVDYISLKKIIEACKKGGASAFVCLGTTAETPTLTEKERSSIISFCVENCYPCPVIVGTGSNCTKEAVRLSKECVRFGAHGILSVVPYYNKPSKTGIIEHFRYVADSVDLPVILYNVPSRTGCDIDVDTIHTLSHIDNVIGIKEAGNDKNKLKEIETFCSESFALFCGNDHLTIEALDSGCVGFISAGANVLTNCFYKIFTLYRCGDKVNAQNLFDNVKDLIDCIYVETNPIPLKYILSKKGVCKNQFRLPMCPISRKNEQIINNIISKTNIMEVKF